MTTAPTVNEQPTVETKRLTYMAALRSTLRAEMARDESVFVLGEDVEAGTFGMTAGLVDEFGRARVRNTPISEGAIVGAAVGAAMCGLRPFADMSIATFAYVAMDQLVNQAAKNRFLFGGQAKVPAVFHFVQFHRSSAAAQHTDRPHPIMMSIPGLKVVAPSTADDAKGLLAAAIRDDDPVIFFSDMTAWSRRAEVPVDDHVVPLGQARIVRPGTDVTLVAIFTLAPALAAAEELAAQGVSVEVIDPRTLSPLDTATILTSVSRTGRLVVADIAHPVCSAASEIAALAAEHCFSDLTAPVRRVCTPSMHIPYSPPLEKNMFPDQAAIARALRSVVGLTRQDG